MFVKNGLLIWKSIPCISDVTYINEVKCIFSLKKWRHVA
jgi:hypothetical protein